MMANLRSKLSISEMIKAIRYSVLLMTISLLLSGMVCAQRVSFGTVSSVGITLTPLNGGALDFNQKQPILLGGQTVTISLTDPSVAEMTIEARTDLDVTVTIEAPATLDLDVNNTIPLSLGFAYSNVGAPNDVAAKTSAIPVPIGFTSMTFPVLRRASGLPAPPPTPNHAGVTYSTATAYLFFYGTLGAIPGGAAAGIYNGTIHVRVEYAKY
jgi:hypothetical protein